jgi:hypothetical protein
LVGINVDQMFADAQKKGLLYFGDEQKTKEEFLNWFIQDLKEAKYSQEVEEGILDFIQDVIDGRIQVRAHNSKAIHAKFYLFLPQNHSEHTDGWVIMGSSNLTEAGLGIKKSPNYELNIALKDYDGCNSPKLNFKSCGNNQLPFCLPTFKTLKKKLILDSRSLHLKFILNCLLNTLGITLITTLTRLGICPKPTKS